ncbi:het domain protein [Colletotrichum kahawae]|uniref:Het domain protein n=1 Tax=Colletotrichum kahawae TaxID=34407 RepID=A0AAE0CXJ8_COLKA|nr:het domain protein [Colletotrichum kahawae]
MIVCLHVLNDENSGDLNAEHLRVEMDPTEPHYAARKLGLSGHDGTADHRPRRSTGRDSYGILPELHIPPQLKSLRTLCNFTARQPNDLLGPARMPRERFLVSSDVRPGDLLGTLRWGECWDHTKSSWDLAHVILRRTTFADESESQDYDVLVEEETESRRTAFFVHSWAIPVRQECTMLSDIHGLDPSIKGAENPARIHDIGRGRLRLHYRDALVPLLLNHHPLQSLLYYKSALNSEASNLSSWVEDPEDIVDRLEEGRHSGGQGCVCLYWRAMD